MIRRPLTAMLTSSAAYLNGGDRSNFHLVPPDAALPESGLSGAPAGDLAGDALVRRHQMRSRRR